MSKFKIGDKVMLSPDSRWVDCYSRQPESFNPLDVVGVVCGFNTGYDCQVIWNNGKKNSYKDGDLIPIPDAQPKYECPYAVIEELQAHVETLEEALEKVTKELLELREKQSPTLKIKRIDGLDMLQYMYKDSSLYNFKFTENK